MDKNTEPQPDHKETAAKMKTVVFSKGMVHVWEGEFCLQKCQGRSG